MRSHVSLSTPRVQTGTLYFVALLREELGRRIATARAGAGMSQQELASAVGLRHAQDISRYERGKVEVPSHRIDLIAEATGRPRSYFTRDPSEPELSSDDAEWRARLESQLEQVLGIVRDLRAELVTQREAPPVRKPRTSRAK